MNIPRYVYLGENPSITVSVNDDFVDIGTTHITGTFGYFCVISGQETLTLNFENHSSSQKSLYITDEPPPIIRNVVVNPIPSPSPWNVFDNLQYGTTYPLSSISLADIKINVKHLKTGLTYETVVQKPVYSFDFLPQ